MVCFYMFLILEVGDGKQWQGSLKLARHTVTRCHWFCVVWNRKKPGMVPECWRCLCSAAGVFACQEEKGG